MTKKPTIEIVWFKRDLRAHDHAALHMAASTGHAVLPLYVAEPKLWQQADASGRQWAFVADCLIELQRDLATLGAPLVIRTGDMISALDKLLSQFDIRGLWSHQETGNGWTYERDKRVAAWAKTNQIPWNEPRQGGTIRRLKTRDGWAGKWDRFMAQDTLETPHLKGAISGDFGDIPGPQQLGIAPDDCLQRQLGGRDTGLSTLYSFLNYRGEPYRKAMSTPVDAFEHCSRLSPHLAWGSLSMREVAQSTWMRQRELKAITKSGESVGSWRGSMVSFTGRLHWRDHFMQKLEDEPELEFRNLHPGYDGLRTESDPLRLQAWADGETGLPFVDACMRCLKATGWMNFRMRAMLMCVASYHLWLPWRDSGNILAQYFTDYEPGIHWPQTQMQSGTTGINTIRIYNPVKQGLDQDPTGDFTREWLPELSAVPDSFLQTPWKWEGAGQILGKLYPDPIVDPVTAAKEAKEIIYEARRGPAFRSMANAIQEKHGSRKSGMPMTGQKRGRRVKTTPDQGQLNFDLGNAS